MTDYRKASIASLRMDIAEFVMENLAADAPMIYFDALFLDSDTTTFRDVVALLAEKLESARSSHPNRSFM